MYCRCNPDEEIRRAERLAAKGDPAAIQRLQQLQTRAGDPDAIMMVTLHGLLEKLNAWASKDGRSILRGEHHFQWPGEHPFSKHCFGTNSVTRVAIEGDPPGDFCYQLRWEQTIAIDEDQLDELQDQIQDIRLLRPINDVKVDIELSLPSAKTSHHGRCARCGRGTDRVNEPQARGLCYDCQYGLQPVLTVSNTTVNYVYIKCGWQPELIRAGASWHAGWSEYHRPIPGSHPLLEVLAIIEQHLSVPSNWAAQTSDSVTDLELLRQDGPADALSR